LDEAAFLAAVSVHGPRGEAMMNGRPSDAMAQALRVDALMFSNGVRALEGADVAPRRPLSPPPT